MATASVTTTNVNSSVAESYFCSNCLVPFTDNAEYKEHYKSDFHRYNAKRRLVSLAPATMDQFLKKKTQVADLKAQAEKAQVDQSTKCEPCNKSFANKKTYAQHLESTKHKETARNYKPKDLAAAAEKPASPVVRRTTLDDVKICLFCNKECETLDSNLIHMRVAHSFFINDFKFCSDVEGLLKYWANRIQKEITCIYCENKGRDFQTPEAIQNHMISKGHCFMNPEHYRDWEPFYDFSSAVVEDENKPLAIVDEDDEDSEWEDEEAEEDVEEKEEGAEGEEKKDDAEGEKEGKEPMSGEKKKEKIDAKKTKYYYYKNVVKKAQVLSNGEVELANGKIVGNRQFNKYYKQYYRPSGAMENLKKYRTLLDATSERSLALMRETLQLQLFGTHTGARFQYAKGLHYRKNEYTVRMSSDFMIGQANNGVLQKHFRCATP